MLSLFLLSIVSFSLEVRQAVTPRRSCVSEAAGGRTAFTFSLFLSYANEITIEHA